MGSETAGRSDSAGVCGFIFDLDGTLVDSHLDFDAIREEMGLTEGVPVLEALRGMAAERSRECWRILDRHESDGADRATAMPGVPEFLDHLRGLDLRSAVFTRNSRAMTVHMLARCGLEIELALTRDDGPVKPDPWAILEICRHWRTQPAEVVVIGDFRFDIEAGQNAGARTVLFTGGKDPRRRAGFSRADYVLDSFTDADRLLRLLQLPTTRRPARAGHSGVIKSCRDKEM